MGLANWLTIVRILLVPVLVICLVYNRGLLALVTFVVAGITDMMDGYIARTRGTKTRLGAFLDPLADKLLLTASFVTLTYKFPKILPFWLTTIVLSRDLLLILVVMLIMLTGGQFNPMPTGLGKLSTVVQMVTVGVVLKTALIAGVMYLAADTPTAMVLGVVVAQIDPLSVGAMIGRSQMSGRAKAVLLSWASFDDPITALLTIYLLVFALGFIWQAHAGPRLRSGATRKRRSGLGLLLSAAPMVMSGYLLQTAEGETWRLVWIWLHVGTSCLWLLGYLVHQCFARPRGPASARTPGHK